jgi:anthranilate/para-aminobenzoate synthase component II
VRVLSGTPGDGLEPAAPLLAIGDGALWLLQRAGASLETLPEPEFARSVTGRPQAEGFLAGLGPIRAGWYASRALRPEALPRDWMAAALSEEGWVLAAQHRDRPVCALMLRPDSVLSLHAASGRRALQAAFAWLDRGILQRPSGKDK